MPRHLFCVRFINLNLAVFRARKIPHNRKCTMQAGRPVPCRSGLVFGLVWFGLVWFGWIFVLVRVWFWFRCSAQVRCAVLGAWPSRCRRRDVFIHFVKWQKLNKIYAFYATQVEPHMEPACSQKRNQKPKKKKIEIGGRKHTFPPCNVLGCRNFGFEICAKVAWCVLAAKCFLFDAVFQKSRQRLRAKCKTLKFRTLMHCSAYTVPTIVSCNLFIF